jgi:hypothetical protein
MLSIKFFCRRLFKLFICDSDREIVLSIHPNLFGNAREVAERAAALGSQTIHCESFVVSKLSGNSTDAIPAA